jgi:hypothetical protein
MDQVVCFKTGDSGTAAHRLNAMLCSGEHTHAFVFILVSVD